MGGGGGQILQQGAGVGQEHHLQLGDEGSGQIRLEEGGGQLPQLGLVAEGSEYLLLAQQLHLHLPAYP